MGREVERHFFSGRATRKVFVRAFYLRTNPDVAAAGVDPFKHYLKHGAAEQRQPHPLFDPAHYLANSPEARQAGNPLLHFLNRRVRPWPSTHPLFDCEAYAQAHPEIAQNPLVAYLARGSRESALEGCQFGQC